MTTPVSSPDLRRARRRWIVSGIASWTGVVVVATIPRWFFDPHGNADLLWLAPVIWAGGLLLEAAIELFRARIRGTVPFTPPAPRQKTRSRAEQRELERAEARTLIGSDDDPGVQVRGQGPSKAVDQRHGLGRISF